MVFNFLIGPSFIFESGLNLFSGTYLSKLLFLWCTVIDITQSKGSTRLGAFFFLKMETEPVSKMCIF
jgi:hypothetical protein